MSWLKQRNKKQIEKLRASQELLVNKLEELNKKIEDISAGLYDDELKSAYDDMSKNSIKINEEKTTKKNTDKRNKTVKEKSCLDQEYRNRRNEGSNEYQMQKETDRYFKICETVPEYITENLKSMPFNKGYIWKGAHFYGHKPAESNTVIMFEKLRGGVLRIHETDNKFYSVYDKVGKNQKKLVSKTVRVPILTKEEIKKITS